MLTTGTALAVDGNKAAYIGVTMELTEKTERTFSTQRTTEAVFATRSGTLRIPYDSIESLECGQKAGRRVAGPVLVSPVALFSKKRNHYLTITYKGRTATSRRWSSSWARTSCAPR